MSKIEDEKNVSRGSILTRIRVPHVYVLLFFILIFVTICTYIVPAGVFERVQDANTGRMVVDPASFHHVDRTPVGFLQFALAIPSGMEAAVNIMMLVVLVVAALEVVSASGAFDAGIASLMQRSRGKEQYIVALITVLFSIVGSFLGWAEGCLVFVPLGVTLARAMGYDALVGAGMVLLGDAAGFTAGVLNIYTTGIAQALSGLPLFSALAFRLVCYAIFTIMAVMSLLRYGKRIQGNPSLSLVSELESRNETPRSQEFLAFTMQHKAILLTVLIGFAMVAFGTTRLKWYLKEITGVFIIVGIVAGLFARMSFDEIAVNFSRGAQKIIPAALTIGIARGVLVIMEKGQILDTIVHSLAMSLKGLPGIWIVAGIFVIVSFFNFFVVSASGKAVTLMPILAPLADLVGVNRQVAVLAFQFGDGFTNWFWPTSALTMAGLAMAGGIPWEIWARFSYKLFLGWFLAGGALVMVAQLLQVGPF